MGESSTRGAQGRGAAPDAQARSRSRARVLLRPRVSVHVPRGRARRARVRRTSPGRRRRRRRCSGAASPTIRARAERVRDAAEERAAALRLPLVWPERFPTAGARRDARRRPTRPSRAAARAFVLAAARLAFCGGFDLDDPEILAEAAAAAGLAARRLPARRARRAAATARSRRPAAACSARAPTGCRRCGSGARCSGARSASARPRRRCGSRPPALARRASSRALRADEPGEDLRVDRVDRLGALGVVRDAARGSAHRGRPRRAAGRGPRTACGCGVR